MARYIQTVVTGPVEGSDEEFNRWYEEIHLSEVLGLPGYVSAQRFVLATPGESGPRYLTLYEIESDDIDATLAAIGEKASSLTMSTAMDPAVFAMSVYRALGERRGAEPAA